MRRRRSKHLRSDSRRDRLSRQPFSWRLTTAFVWKAPKAPWHAGKRWELKMVCQNIWIQGLFGCIILSSREKLQRLSTPRHPQLSPDARNCMFSRETPVITSLCISHSSLCRKCARNSLHLYLATIFGVSSPWGVLASCWECPVHVPRDTNYMKSKLVYKIWNKITSPDQLVTCRHVIHAKYFRTISQIFYILWTLCEVVPRHRI